MAMRGSYRELYVADLSKTISKFTIREWYNLIYDLIKLRMCLIS